MNACNGRCPACCHENENLHTELMDLRELVKRYSNILANGGPRTQNTDMIMGAMLSGGNVMELAKTLANKK